MLSLGVTDGGKTISMIRDVHIISIAYYPKDNEYVLDGVTDNNNLLVSIGGEKAWEILSTIANAESTSVEAMFITADYPDEITVTIYDSEWRA